MDGYDSELYEIMSGVPQGSHLGPVLFNIFVNDITDCFNNSTVFLYADDLKFARTINSISDIVLLQDDINRLVDWCDRNGMLLNIKKCFHMKFTRKHNITQSTYTISHETIRELDVVRDLGVVFDAKLTFIPHIDYVVKQASKMLGFIIRNGKVFRNKKTKILLYNALVRSKLEYCSIVWRPHYATHNLRIERVQKRFMWHLSRATPLARRKVSYQTRLTHFKMTSLLTRKDLLDLKFMYKLLRNQIDCPLLLLRITFRAPSRYPRNRITPLVPPPRRTVLGANSPIPRLCKLINKCDLLDIHYDSLNSFRRHLLGT